MLGPSRRLPCGLLAWLRRVRRAVRAYGFVGVSKRAWANARSLPAQRRSASIGREYDERFGVDTAGVVRLEGIAVLGPNRDLGHRYQASDPAGFRHAIASLKIDYRDFVFIDVGSGKGRALLLASDFPFKKIIGVEFSEELHRVAVRNIKAYTSRQQRCTALQSLCIDAVEYDFPPDALVIYFYNPFLQPVMESVMSRLQASMRALPRPAYVVLAGDAPVAHVIEHSGFARIGEQGVISTSGVFAATAVREG